MDYIEKALEKAQSERKVGTSNRGMSVRGWVNPTPTTRQFTVEGLDAQPVQLDPAELFANHILCGSPLEDAVVADRYRLLRTRVIQLMRPHGWTKLGISSPGSKAGKSLTSLNLAITFARDVEHQVVLVDADMRKPSVAYDLGFEPEIGLADYLSSEADIPLEEVLLRPSDLQNLLILPGRREEDQTIAPELLSSDRMARLLKSLQGADHKNIVIVDLPPTQIGDDVIALASHLDSVLLVVAEGRTNVDELRESAALLAEFNLLGTVLNKSVETTRPVEGYYQSGATPRAD